MKKVSVLSPCYNVEKYIGRFLDSIIEQNYYPLELILVNDGSTDNTETIIKSYEKKIKAKGIDLKYIYKENGGQASACSIGLKEVTGDYLIWPDSDDFLLKDSLASRVDFMENHPEYGILRANAEIISEDDENNIIGYVTNKKNNKKENIFRDLALFRSYWCPGCYMVRVSALKAANPDLYIYESRAGQNIQMLVPIAYKFKCAYIDMPVYAYRIRQASHSHSASGSMEKQLEQVELLEDTMINTLMHMDKDAQKIIPEVKIRCIELKYNASYIFENKAYKIKYFNQLKQKKALTLPLRLMMLRKNKFIDRLRKVYDRVLLCVKE